jgi:hypothetical protein
MTTTTTQSEHCIATVESWSRNRYTKGWYQSAPPRQCKNKTRPGEGTCRFTWEAQPPTEVLKGVTGRVARGRRRSRCNGYRTTRRKELLSERLVDSDQIVRPAGIGPTSNPYRCPRLA